MSDATGFTLLVFLSVLVLFIGLLPIVGKWKVYEKLGMPGWYSIIPVYADYKLCERVHRTDEGRTFLMAYLIVLNDMSRTFGKETGYTIGLVIFGFLFWTMLGFGSSEPVRMGDEDEME